MRLAARAVDRAAAGDLSPSTAFAQLYLRAKNCFSATPPTENQSLAEEEHLTLTSSIAEDVKVFFEFLGFSCAEAKQSV